MRLHDKAMPIPRPKSCISLWIFAMRHVVWAVVVARFSSGRLSQKWSLRWACNWKEYGYALDGLRFTSFLNRLNKTLFVIKLGCGAQLGPMPEMAVLCRSGVWGLNLTSFIGFVVGFFTYIKEWRFSGQLWLECHFISLNSFGGFRLS